MIITYKEVNKNKLDVLVQDEHIGYVYRDVGKTLKWKIHANFDALISDGTKLKDDYYESIKAGRVLSESWERLKNFEKSTDDDYDVPWLDVFGTD